MIKIDLRNLARDDQGVAIIELALVAPMLALVTIGIVDISNAFNHKLALEQGAQRAIEKIVQTTADSTVEATLAAEAVCQVNGTNAQGTCNTAPINTSNVTITFRLECIDSAGGIVSETSSSSSEFDNFVCGGSAVKQARYIQIAIKDRYSPVFLPHFAGYDKSDGKYPISAVAGMRTK